MEKKRVSRRQLVLFALLAGLAATALALAQVAPRAKSAPHAVRFLAPDPGGVSYYEFRITDVTRDSTYVVSNLPYEVLPGAAGAPDTHLVYLELTFHHLYQGQVRAFNVNHVPGLWSVMSDVFEMKSPNTVPDR